MFRRRHIEVYEAKNGWWWRERAANGQITCTAHEAYASKGNAMRAARVMARPRYRRARVVVVG